MDWVRIRVRGLIVEFRIYLSRWLVVSFLKMACGRLFGERWGRRLILVGIWMCRFFCFGVFNWIGGVGSG